MDRDISWRVCHMETVDSTNTRAKELALSGVRNSTLIYADAQLSGRGRMDRRWESPAGAGLWMSQLFFPENMAAADAGGAVFLSAQAMCVALRRMTGAEVMIKWPNDLVLNGKKICGMLAECGFDGARCDWIVLGTGLNLKSGALPPELRYASSIETETGLTLSREDILGEYLPEFDRLAGIWETEGLAAILCELRPFSATIGRDVRVNGEPARALDIGPGGVLMIIDDKGNERAVLAGDVSVRGITDYV